ncbi:MAG: hypothetical protein ACFB0C_02125 [Leptolyngbyaceae cyanobacterium]
MQHQNDFHRHRLIAQVALQQELNERLWQPPIHGITECPQCHSSEIGKLMSVNEEGKTHRCRSCKAYFSANDVSGCTCWYPGKLEKCLDCPQYERLNAGVKARMQNELKDMTAHQAEQLLSQRSFYADRKNIQKSPEQPVTAVSAPAVIEAHPEGPTEQLKLF